MIGFLASRRGFLAGLIAAPFVARMGILMPVRSIIAPEPVIETGAFKTYAAVVDMALGPDFTAAGWIVSPYPDARYIGVQKRMPAKERAGFFDLLPPDHPEPNMRVSWDT